MKSALSALLIIFLASPAARAHADERTLYVDVTAGFEARSAVGLLLAAGGTREIPAQLEDLQHGAYRVKFSIDPEQVEPGTTVTALVTGRDGKTAMGGVRSITMIDDQGRPPACVTEATLRNDNLSIYEKLIKLRDERRSLLRQGVEKELNKELRDKLTTLERGFGLEHEPAIGTDLNPYVLVDRLARLRDALREYVASRPKSPTTITPAE